MDEEDCRVERLSNGEGSLLLNNSLACGWKQ